MHRGGHLPLALGVVEHRAGAHTFVLESLPVGVELLGRYVEGQMIHGAHRAGDVADAGDGARRRDARYPIGRVGEPEESDTVAVAGVEEEVLPLATG